MQGAEHGKDSNSPADPPPALSRRPGIAVRILLILALSIVAVLGVGLVLKLLNPLPPLEPRTASGAIADGEDTRIGRSASRMAADHPGLSGIYPLVDARAAFAARALLIAGADRSIDLQYYIWHRDISGTLLLEEIARAADRGVRVRLLLDDNGVAGLDEILAALDRHPRIEVRLYNPFTIRRPKAIGYIMDFFRLNRRMHNKALIADGQAAIVGGRNVGDEYFGASAHSLFADLDVLAIGAIVPDVSKDFDRYWASASAYPASAILPEVSPERFDALMRAASIAESKPLALAYRRSIAESDFLARLIEGRIAFEWARVRMVSDDPAKTLGTAPREALLAYRLAEVTGAPQRSLDLVSAYFVPTRAGTEAFSGLVRRGVNVAILTNSLAATDVALVHAGYARHRKALLRSGVRLFEMKGGADAELTMSLAGSGGQSGPVFRSSGSSLHAKTFAADGRTLFVGSFNFDPRSVDLNTELGFVIESPKLAGELEGLFEKGLAAHAYELRLSDGGKRIEWVEETGAGPVIHTTEPGTGRVQRGVVAVMSRLPIDWLL